MFSQGYKEGIQQRDVQMINEEAKNDIMNEDKTYKRVGPVDENLKFGRRKKTANLFKAPQSGTS